MSFLPLFLSIVSKSESFSYVVVFLRVKVVTISLRKFCLGSCNSPSHFLKTLVTFCIKLGGGLFITDGFAFGSVSNLNDGKFLFKKEKKCQKGVINLSLCFWVFPGKV